MAIRNDTNSKYSPPSNSTSAQISVSSSSTNNQPNTVNSIGLSTIHDSFVCKDLTNASSMSRELTRQSSGGDKVQSIIGFIFRSSSQRSDGSNANKAIKDNAQSPFNLQRSSSLEKAFDLLPQTPPSNIIGFPTPEGFIPESDGDQALADWKLKSDKKGMENPGGSFNFGSSHSHLQNTNSLTTHAQTMQKKSENFDEAHSENFFPPQRSSNELGGDVGGSFSTSPNASSKQLSQRTHPFIPFDSFTPLEVPFQQDQSSSSSSSKQMPQQASNLIPQSSSSSSSSNHVSQPIPQSVPYGSFTAVGVPFQMGQSSSSSSSNNISEQTIQPGAFIALSEKIRIYQNRCQELLKHIDVHQLIKEGLESRVAKIAEQIRRTEPSRVARSLPVYRYVTSEISPLKSMIEGEKLKASNDQMSAQSVPLYEEVMRKLKKKQKIFEKAEAVPSEVFKTSRIEFQNQLNDLTMKISNVNEILNKLRTAETVCQNHISNLMNSQFHDSFGENGQFPNRSLGITHVDQSSSNFSNNSLSQSVPKAQSETTNEESETTTRKPAKRRADVDLT